MTMLHAAVAVGCPGRAGAPCMATVVSFRDRALLGDTRMQLAPHLVRLAVALGEKMLSSPPHGMLRSLHANTLSQSQPSASMCAIAGQVLCLS